MLDAAKVDVAGREAALAGHSYGAICAMGAASLRPVPKLILDEAPLSVGGPAAAHRWPVSARAVAAQGNERAMEICLAMWFSLQTQGHPRLQRMAAAPPATWRLPGPCELEAMDEITSVEPYRALRCPVLLLAGGATSPTTPTTIHPTLSPPCCPGARVEALPGQWTIGLRGAPHWPRG